MSWQARLVAPLAVAFCIAALLIPTSRVAAKDLAIAWVHSNASTQSENRAKAGLNEWLKKTGKTWKVSFLDSKGSGELTASNIQDAVSRNVDAIIVSMADLRASSAAIAAAKQHNIPVFSIDSGWVPGAVVDVTTNNWAMSADVSLFFLNLLDGEGGIIFLRMAEHHGTRKRGDVMATMLKEFPKVKVLAEHNIDYKAFFEDTTRVMEDYVARFGNQIKGVWAPWDEPAQAAVSVLKAHNIKAWVTGIDGHPGAVAAVKNQSTQFAATVAQPFEQMGGKCGEWIQAVVVEKKDPAKLFATHTIYLPAPLIAKW
jgi:ribose transport system substrate-binding protein